MYAELLLALSGCPGDIFTVSEKGGIQVQCVCAAGYRYKRIHALKMSTIVIK